MEGIYRSATKTGCVCCVHCRSLVLLQTKPSADQAPLFAYLFHFFPPAESQYSPIVTLLPPLETLFFLPLYTVRAQTCCLEDVPLRCDSDRSGSVSKLKLANRANIVPNEKKSHFTSLTHNTSHMTGLTNPEGIIPQAAIDEIRHFCLSAPFRCLLAVVVVSMYRDVCWYQTAAFPDSGQRGKRTSTSFIGKSRWGTVPVMKYENHSPEWKAVVNCDGIVISTFCSCFDGPI